MPGANEGESLSGRREDKGERVLGGCQEKLRWAGDGRVASDGLELFHEGLRREGGREAGV